MNKFDLCKLLCLDIDKEVDLSLDSCANDKKKDYKEKIEKLFDIALLSNVIVYYDGRYVMEPYEDYEFKTEEEEFYYYNQESYLVFVDDNGKKARFKIRDINNHKYSTVYKVVEKACNYTKAHPWVSKNKLY